MRGGRDVDPPALVVETWDNGLGNGGLEEGGVGAGEESGDENGE